MSQLPRPTRSLLSLGLPKHILSSLMRNGYETKQDLNNVTAASLSSEIGVSLDEVDVLLARLVTPSTPDVTVPATQSAAAILQLTEKISTGCEPLDKILEGGLCRGQILEISGPPGSPKEQIVKGIVASYAENGQKILFIDCQNMVLPSSLAAPMKKEDLRHVHYAAVHTLPGLLVLVQQLTRILKIHPKISLLVFNSISFPFQAANSKNLQRNSLLATFKKCLAKATASYNLTVVTTSQLATKMVNADGTAGNFETGAKGIMLPALGSEYLPNSKTHRMILIPDGLRSGVIALSSSPKNLEKHRSISLPYSLDSSDLSIPGQSSTKPFTCA